MRADFCYWCSVHRQCLSKSLFRCSLKEIRKLVCWAFAINLFCNRESSRGPYVVLACIRISNPIVYDAIAILRTYIRPASIRPVFSFGPRRVLDMLQ